MEKTSDQQEDSAIFDIFTNVKTVQEATYGFIAGGLKDDKLARQGIDASNTISAKTEELTSKK